MNKTEARKLYKEKRSLFTEKDIEEKSLDIANRLLQLPIWNHSFYHLFLSIVKNKEVDTLHIMNILNGKDKNIVISKSNFKTGELSHYLLTDNTAIKPNKWGIPEPVESNELIEVKESKIEVVFVPLLAYDKAGNRVGYGKGFYDRFLLKCTPKTLKIGLSFFPPEDKLEPILDTDIRLDYCITPEQTIKF